MTISNITPFQTVGPFYAYCLTPNEYATLPTLFSNDIVTDDVEGQPITIRGTITDGEGAVVPDALVEIWQPDGLGRFAGSHRDMAQSQFKGFGRVHCDEAGTFEFRTVKPGGVPTVDGILQAPHVAVSIFGKGLNRRLYTRVYFDDEASNDQDPILTQLSAAEQATLIAKSGEVGSYSIQIRLQGPGETVFFEV